MVSEIVRPGRRQAALALTAAALFAAGCGSSSSGASSSSSSGGGNSSSAAATPVKFDAVFDLSGQLATFGKDCEVGLQLAADQINGTGGFTVAGHKYMIKLDIADGRTDPTATVAATRNFLQAGDKFLFGPDTDATSLQMLGVTKGADIIQFAGGAADQTLMGKAGHEDTFGVVTPNATWEGAFVPLLRAVGVSSGTVAILYPNDGSGTSVAPQIAKILDGQGYQAKVFLFPATTSDFRSVLDRAKAVSPAAIIDGYTAQWGLPIAQAAVQLNATKAIVGWNQSPDSVPLVIGKSLGHPFPLRWANATNDQQAAAPTTPAMRAFRNTWIKYLHQQPTADESQVAIWFYDAALNAVAGMEKAGTVSDPSAIASAIKAMTFNGAETIHYVNNLPIHGTDYAVVQAGKVQYHYLPASAS